MGIISFYRTKIVIIAIVIDIDICLLVFTSTIAKLSKYLPRDHIALTFLFTEYWMRPIDDVAVYFRLFCHGLIMKPSWHGNAFHSIGPLWADSTEEIFFIRGQQNIHVQYSSAKDLTDLPQFTE